MLQIKYSSIVNIILNKKVVNEFLQDKMKPNLLSEEIIDLLNTESKGRKKMLDDFNSIKQMLGDSGVFLRIADLILKRT